MVNKIDVDQDKISVTGGLLNGHYSIIQFDVCPQGLLGMDGVSVDATVPIRKAVSS